MSLTPENIDESKCSMNTRSSSTHDRKRRGSYTMVVAAMAAHIVTAVVNVPEVVFL